MSIKIADLAAAIRNASEGDDRALIDLPLAGASLGEMTSISCTGKLYNDLQSSNRMIIKQRDAIEHLRGEVDDRSNHADCLELRLEKLERRHNEQVEAMRAEIDALRAAERRAWEQSVTIAALRAEIAAFNA